MPLSGTASTPASWSARKSRPSCWRNWKAFLAYGLGLMFVVLLLVALIGQFALGLGMLQATGPVLTILFLLVLAPILFATFYISYRDVFTAPPAVDETA